MDSFSEKIKKLVKNRYFTYIIVIILAFLTALIISFASYQAQSDQASNLPVYQSSDNQNQPSFPGPGNQASQSQKPKSVIDTILEAIGIKPKTNDQVIDQPQTTDPNNQSGQNNNLSPIPTQTPEQKKALIETIKNQAQPLPKIQANDYVLKIPIPTPPQTSAIYNIKTNYNESEIKTFANNLGFKDIDLYQNYQDTSQLYDINNGLYLAFHPSNGEFLFMSDNGIIPQASSQDPKITAQSFLAEIGINPACQTPYAIYNRESKPLSTYVEFHCNWDQFGAPIYNAMGILNMSQDQAFSDIKIGQISPNAPQDNDVVSHSSGTVGLRSSNDFNTIIVEVKNNNLITSVASKIPLTMTRQDLSTDQIISPQTIIDNLKQGKTHVSLSTPAGDGSLNLANVYPNNIATSKSIEIFDIAYAFDMSPGITKSTICPRYFIRGKGILASGYEANFAFTTQAVNNPACSQTNVLGLKAQANPTVIPTQIQQSSLEDDTLHYGTLKFEPGLPTNKESSCPVNFNHAYKIDDNLYMAWIDENQAAVNQRNPGQRIISRMWYLVTIKGGEANQQLDQQALKQLATEKRRQLSTLRAQLVNKCTAGDSSDCPLPEGFEASIMSCEYFTTGSPRIYISTPIKQKISLKINSASPVSYVNPGFNLQNGWQLIANPQGNLIINQVEKQSLYWEYQRQPLLNQIKTNWQPENGFIVNKNNLNDFVENLSLKLNLNPLEKQDLLTELVRETSSLPYHNLQISIIPKKIISQFINYDINPKPNKLHRVFFYITKANNKLKEPHLSSLTRQGLTVIEFGVLVDN